MLCKTNSNLYNHSSKKKKKFSELGPMPEMFLFNAPLNDLNGLNFCWTSVLATNSPKVWLDHLVSCLCSQGIPSQVGWDHTGQQRGQMGCACDSAEQAEAPPWQSQLTQLLGGARQVRLSFWHRPSHQENKKGKKKIFTGDLAVNAIGKPLHCTSLRS